MKYLVALGLIIGCLLNLHAQPDIQWQKSLGGSQLDVAYSSQSTPDGGFIVVGKTLSNNGDVFGNHGGNDFWVIKLDATGQVIWKKCLGGSNNDRATSVFATSDFGYIVAGHSESNNGQVSGNHGGIDSWVVKLDANGMIAWQLCLGGSGWEDASKIIETKDKGFAFAGRTTSFDGDVVGYQGNIDAWVVKLTSSGTIQWQKSLGGSDLDIAYSLAETTDGGIVVVGESASNDGDLSGVHGSTDYMVVKLDAQGEVVWQKMYGTSSIDRANDIYPTNDGGFIVGGQISGSDGDVSVHKGSYDIWVIKLDSLGSLQWEKTVGGSGLDICSSLIQVDDNKIVLVGVTQSTDGDAVGNNGGEDLWVIQVSENGSLIWQKTLGGSQSEIGSSVIQTNDDGLLIVGESRSANGDVLSNQGSSDFWIVKLASETSSTQTPAAIPLNLYPNPATQWITLSLPIIEQNMQVSITDEQGRVLQIRSIRTDEKLDIAALPKGIYWVSALSKSGQLYSGKFVKG
ncbi:MAG TPA: T9SS type A sorting domain-containing protein [Saprospiraceae bacterium]|nr:T9SS type A sorting domain-containing protein [Saprospiraceae bacterium]